MRLWVVRHAAPRVAIGLCYGRLDVPAQEKPTQRAAQRLAAVLPASFDLHCSPSLRCRKLANALQALVPAVSSVTDPRLQEMNFGAWEGRQWDEIGRPAIEAWTASFARHAAGDGESVHDLMLRVGEAFSDAVPSPRDVVWITHAGVVRAVRLLARGTHEIQEARDWPAEAARFGHWEIWPLSGPP